MLACWTIRRTKGERASMDRRSRTPLLLMALTVFIDLTGFGIILPLLPFWAERLGANPVEVGLILTLYALAQLIFTPLLGTLSDRYGRRPVIVGSLLIEAAGFALTALAGSLPLLLAARFIGGIGASNIGSAQAVVADTTPPEERARGMGLIGAAIGMGFVVGPAIGGVLAAIGGVLAGAGAGAALPFWVAMGVALLNALLVTLLLPETRRRTAISPRAAGAALAGASWRQVLGHPAIVRLVAINLLFTLAFSAMEAVFPLFTQAGFGWGATQNGYVFTFVGVVIVLVQGGLVGQLARRFGERALLAGGLGLLAVGLALLPLSSTLALLLVALGILSAGDGLVTPATSALLSIASPSDAQGQTLGIAQGAAGLGRILGPLGAGALFAAGAGLPFVAGAGLALVALAFALPRLPAPDVSATQAAESATNTRAAAATGQPAAADASHALPVR
ncbi:MAG TPA: MFS transporter [Ktedonobacterales bacterium]